MRRKVRIKAGLMAMPPRIARVALGQQEVFDLLASAANRRAADIGMILNEEDRVRKGETEDERVRLQEFLPFRFGQVLGQHVLELLDHCTESHLLNI